MLIEFNGVEVDCYWHTKIKAYVPRNVVIGKGWYEDHIRDSRIANKDIAEDEVTITHV